MSTPIPSLGNKTPEQLKVAELREELKKRGINIKGLKKDLVERLDDALRQEVSEVAEAAGAAEDHSEKPSSKDGPVDAVDGADIHDVETEPAEMPSANAAELLPESLEAKDIEPEPLVEPQQLVEEVLLADLVLVPDTIPAAEPIEAADILPPADSLPPAEEPAPQVYPEIQDTFVEESLSKTDVPVSDETLSDEKMATIDEVVEPLRDAIFGAEVEATDGAGLDGEESSAVITDDVRAFDEDVKADSVNLTSEPSVISGTLDKPMAESMDTAVQEQIIQEEADVQADEVKPFRASGPASSTDAVIIEATEAEEVPSERVAASAMDPPIVFSDKGDLEEGEGSGGGEILTEPLMESAVEETTVVETVVTETVVTETVVTTERIVETEVEGDLSVAGRRLEGRSSETRMLLDNEEQEKDEEKDEETSAGDVTKLKDAKPMEVDSESLTGSKRKDEEESRYQEPTKRQRRWNSEKSGGTTADASSPKVVTTDTLKDILPPEGRESTTQATLTRSPSTTASSTPKASVSTMLDKSASSKQIALSRPDASANGEVDKKRTVPPPTRSPTVSLKIDRFVRPFTIKAVRELLEQTGKVQDMWMDQIKTHCFVTYSSIEESIATRNAVYNLQWPAAGGKLLVAEFVESEEVTSRVEGTHDKQAATPVTTPRGVANSPSVQGGGSTGLSPGVASLPTSAPPPVQAPPSVSRERTALPPKKEVEPPIPTLDDLFKKTRVKPQIYFLPLTEEQVANKLRNKKPSGKPSMRA